MAAAAPHRIEIVPWGHWKSAVGTWVRFFHQTHFGGGIGYNSSSAVNDEVVSEVLLGAGTWALDVIWYRDTNRAIGTYYLDATSLGTIDQYGSSALNQVTTLSGITVATTGTYELKAKATSKHASSSSYILAHHLLVLRRTGA